MRTRAVGRPAAARASSRGASSGGPQQVAVSARSPHLDDGTGIKGGDQGFGTGPGDRGLGPIGGDAQKPPAVALGHGHHGRVSLAGRGQHDVIGLAGLDDEAAPARPAPQHPGGPGQKDQSLLVGPLTGRQQLLVEVQEGHGRGRAHPVKDGIGADHHPGPRSGFAGRGGGRHLGDRLAQQRLQFFAGPGHSGSQVAQHRRPAPQAHRRALLAAAGGNQHPLLDHHGRPAVAGADQLAAGTAGQQPRPAGAVEHADHRPGSGQPGRQSLGEQPAFDRVVVAAVDHLHHRPALPLRVPVRAQQLPGPQRLQRRRRRGEHRRASSPLGPLQCHIPGVPGRRGGGLQSLVVLVEHRHRGQVRHRHPGRGPRPHHRAAAPGRGGPAVRGDRHPDPGPAQGPGHSPGRGRLGDDHQGVAPTGRGQRHRRRVLGRRQPQDRDPRSPPFRSRSQDSRAGQGDGHGVEHGRVARAQPRPKPGQGVGVQPRPEPPLASSGPARHRAGHRPGRRCQPQERHLRTGPAPSRPSGQVHQIRRGAEPAQPGQRPQFHSVRRCDPHLGHPAADPAAAEVDPHHRPCLQSAGPAVGVPGLRNGVGEGPVDGHHVGADAHRGQLPHRATYPRISARTRTSRPRRGRPGRAGAGTVAQSPSSDFKASTRSVLSQVNRPPSAGRPKCP